MLQEFPHVITPIAALGYLAWFAVVLVRRLRAPQLRSMPARARIGALGLDTLLLPAAAPVAGLSGTSMVLATLLLPPLALGLWTFARRGVTSKVLPCALVGIGIRGLWIARGLVRGNLGIVGHYGLSGNGSGDPFAHLVLAQACAFIIAGLWLAWRRMDPASRVSRLVLRVPGGSPGQPDRPRWGLLLLAVFGMLTELLGWSRWLAVPWWNPGLTAAVGLGVVAVIVFAPTAAADLAVAGVILFGLYGIALALWWPMSILAPAPFADVRYGAFWVASEPGALLAGAQGLLLLNLGLWLLPRAVDDRTRARLGSVAKADLAIRVVRLTRSRSDAIEAAEAELRRVERDLHDGAQGRLITLGMNLRAAEQLIPSNPETALALVAEAREASVTVLNELRDIVRGICPPVLADRGLADAVRALALDAPLRTVVDIDLPGRPDLPVESACYFAVAEALANAVQHSAATQVQIAIGHRGGSLRITITDDGIGGADPQRGSGLLGLERRLGTFDGILAVSSPSGGPTIVAIEVPCALSSLKTSTC